MGKLDGKVAIVTGSGRGLGLAYVKALANEGARITVAELDESSGKAAAKELGDAGAEALFVKCDVANRDDVKNCVQKTVETFGKIDILVNNAQFIPASASVIDTTLQSMELAWKTGPLGTLFFMQEAFPYLKKNGGRIINTASATGARGDANFAAYGSAKEAIRGLTKVAATEFGQYGITVNIIIPNAMTPATMEWKAKNPEQYAKIVENIPLRRLGDPDTDLAPALVFLASDDSKFMTGQTFGVNGGSHFAV